MMKGLTTLSVLASLALLGVLLCGVYAALKVTLNARARALESATIVEESETLLHIIDTAIARYDNHRLHTAPKIHLSGTVTDGSGNTIMLREQLAPHPDGSALSFLTLSIENTLRLSTCNPSVYCPAFSKDAASTISSTDDTGIAIFAAMTLDGIFQVSSAHPAAAGCAALPIIPSSGVILRPLPASYLCDAYALVPIAREETWYVDKKGTLRVMTHQGEVITSNQPVRDTFPLPHFELEHHTGAGIITLAALLSPSRSETWIHSTNHLSRISAASFILGLP